MKKTALLFIIFILTILGCSSQLNANKTENEQINSFVSDYKVLVLDGVNVIDGTGAPVKFSMSITIENGKITAISSLKASAIKLNENCAVVYPKKAEQ